MRSFVNKNNLSIFYIALFVMIYKIPIYYRYSLISSTLLLLHPLSRCFTAAVGRHVLQMRWSRVPEVWPLLSNALPPPTVVVLAPPHPCLSYMFSHHLTNPWFNTVQVAQCTLFLLLCSVSYVLPCESACHPPHRLGCKLLYFTL